MQDAIHPAVGNLDLPQLFRLWLIDDRTCALLRNVRPIIAAALDGQEADFDAALVADTPGDRRADQAELRGREVDSLAAFWRAMFGGELDEGTIARAAELGREHLQLGLDGRYVLAASQRVLRRAHDALIGARVPELDRACDAVTRLVLLGADVALTAYYDRLAQLVSQTDVRRQTLELQEQVRELEELAHVDALDPSCSTAAISTRRWRPRSPAPGATPSRCAW